MIGISLGGNLLLKYLGETGLASGLTTAVAVSVPFYLDKTARHLQRGSAKIYQQYLLRKLLASHRQKFAQRPDPLQVDLTSIKTIYDFDDQITAPLNGFTSADDYYQQCSSIGYLKKIETPTLILHAADDPFMPTDAMPKDAQLGTGVTLEVTRYGGHVGFISGRFPSRADYWIETRIAEYLQAELKLSSG